MTQKHEPELVALVRKHWLEGMTKGQMKKLLGMSIGQISGIIARYGITRSEKINELNKRLSGFYSTTAKKNPGKLLPGSLGVVERQTHDLSRITLVAIPSLGDLQPAAYSYIARDQILGKKTKGRRSAA